MRISTKYLGFAVVVAACTADRTDVCDGATSGQACRWAGTGAQGFNRVNPNSDRLESMLNSPTDVTFGPDGRAYIVDWNNHMVRRVEQDQSLRVVIGTLAEADGQKPDDLDHKGPDPAHPFCNPPGAIGTDVALNHPVQSVFGPDGLLYLAAWHNNKVRTLDPATGMVKTIAGDFYNTGGAGGDGGPACDALFNQPSSLAVSSDGTIYVADQRDVRIRTISAERIVSPLAGVQGMRCVMSDGTGCSLGDGGPMDAALFGWDTSNTPQVSGALLLVGRTLYVSDSANDRIRRIDLETGIIDCIAGNSAQPGYSGDGGPALDAKLNWPLGLALGPDGRLYVADRNNHAVRAIDLKAQPMTIETVVGDGTLCDVTQQVCPDTAPALQMELNQPYGVKFDASGDLYVVDTLNNRILKVIQ